MQGFVKRPVFREGLYPSADTVKCLFAPEMSFHAKTSLPLTVSDDATEASYQATNAAGAPPAVNAENCVAPGQGYLPNVSAGAHETMSFELCKEQAVRNNPSDAALAGRANATSVAVPKSHCSTKPLLRTAAPSKRQVVAVLSSWRLASAPAAGAWLQVNVADWSTLPAPLYRCSSLSSRSPPP